MPEKPDSGNSSTHGEQGLVLRHNASTPAPSPVVYLEPLQTAPTSGSHGPGLFDFVHVLRRRRLALFLFGLVGLFAVSVVLLLQEPLYESKTTLEVVETFPSNSVVLRLGDSPGATGGGMSGETYIQTQAAILQSRSVTQATMARLRGENRNWSFTPTDVVSVVRKRLGLARGTANEPLPAVDFKVRVMPDTSILEITAQSSNPKLAAGFANALVQEYLQGNLSQTGKDSQQNLEWMGHQLDNLKEKLQAAEAQLQSYGHASGIVLEADHPDTGSAPLMKLQDELAAAQENRIMRQSTYEVATANPTDALPQVIENSQLSEDERKLSDLRRELARMRLQWTPAYHKVGEVSSQVKELEGVVQKEREAVLDSIRNDYEAAKIRESHLQNAYATMQREVLARTEKAVNYDIQKREVDSLRTLYDELLKKSQSAIITSAARTQGARVIDAARPADRPANLKVLPELGMGWVIATFFGAVFLIARTYFKTNLTAPGETPLHLHTPELAVIPRFLPTTRRTVGSKKYSLFQGHDEDDNWQERVHLLGANRRSPVTEAYLNAAASLLGHGRNGAPWQVLLATSTERGDGKSTTVSNLGIALAETGRRIAVVDADLRRPRLHEIFGTPNSWGLSDLLTETTSLEELPLKSLVRSTDVPNLWILPSGPGVESVHHLLYSPRLERLLRRLRNEFDLVLIDTPPMLSVSDARVIGKWADGAVLMIRSGKTSTTAAAHAKRVLEADGIQLMGTILTAWDAKQSGRFGYYPSDYLLADYMYISESPK